VFKFLHVLWARQYHVCAMLVKIAQGFLFCELCTMYNSVNDPSEICTMHLCCKFVFLQWTKEYKASNVLTDGFPDCTKYAFGIVLAVF